MKKQKIQLVVLAGLCLLCVCAYFAVKHIALPEEEEVPVSATIEVTNFDTDDTVQLNASVQGYDLSFVKEDGIWYNAQDREENIDQDTVESLLMDIDNITTDKAIENPEELADYGLQEPSGTITVLLEDGTGVNLLVGASNDLTGDYYIKLDGSDTVYTASSYIITDFMKGPDAFVRIETETETESGTDTAVEAETETEMQTETDTVSGN